MLLELFPDEILLDVFDYFDIRDLYKLFYGFSSRLDTIIQSRPNLSLVFSSPDEMDDPFLDFIAAQATKLIIDHSSFIDLQLFSYLQILIFNSPSDDQLKYLFLCHFPYLIHLEFGIMSNRLSHRAFKDFLHCPHLPSLETCIFHHETNVVSLNRYRQLLSNSSTLRTIWSSSIDLSLSTTNHSNNRSTSRSKDVLHDKLKRLEICCTAMGPSVDEMDYLLQQTPNLETFKLASSEIYHSYEFLEQLATVLRRRLARLQIFDCELFCVMSTEEIDRIYRLHSSFHRIQYELKYGGQCIRLFTE